MKGYESEIFIGRVMFNLSVCQTRSTSWEKRGHFLSEKTTCVKDRGRKVDTPPVTE